MPKRNKILLTVFLLALVGFFDAMYLTLSHYLGTNLECRIFAGCDLVTTSRYAELFGLLPVSMLGVFFYLFSLVSVLVLWSKNNFWLPRVFLAISFSAFIFSLWFTYLQFFVLEALCQYCLLSAVLSLLIFIFSILLLFDKKTH